MNRKLKQQIREAIITGIRRNGERIFNISQSTQQCFVPVNTGMLKHSGVVESIPGGVLIAYRAPYAWTVEVGSEEQPIVGTQIIHKKEHRRKAYTRRDGVYIPSAMVKAHDVRYEGKRVIRFRPKLSKFEFQKPIFRVISKIKAREGQYFLTRSVKEGLPFLSQDIAFSLNRIGKVQ